MNIPYESEKFDHYSIDIVLPSENYAIEILGPAHYIFPSETYNGRTIQKLRNL